MNATRIGLSAGAIVLLHAGSALAQGPAAPLPQEATRAAIWVAIGAGLPLLAVTATAFTKLAVVLGILRGGLGVPGALPATVLTGMAAALALLVMAPVGRQVATAVGDPREAGWGALGERGWPPLAAFLERHTGETERTLIADLAVQLDPARAPHEAGPETLIPAFVITELRLAFELGVLLLIPFLVVDLLVANTLAVLGFALLPPTLVALPFKLLLFLAVDGWVLLTTTLVGGYVGPT